MYECFFPLSIKFTNLTYEKKWQPAFFVLAEHGCFHVLLTIVISLFCVLYHTVCLFFSIGFFVLTALKELKACANVATNTIHTTSFQKIHHSLNLTVYTVFINTGEEWGTHWVHVFPYICLSDWTLTTIQKRNASISIYMILRIKLCDHRVNFRLAYREEVETRGESW